MDLDPNSVTVLMTYEWFLTTSGRFDEVDVMFKRALELDPLGRLTALDAGWASFMARRYDQSIRQLQRVLDLGLDLPYAQAWLAADYVQMVMLTEAAASVDRADDLAATSEDQNLLAVLGWVYGSIGREEDAGRIIDRINKGFVTIDVANR